MSDHNSLDPIAAGFIELLANILAGVVTLIVMVFIMTVIVVALHLLLV